MGLPVLSKTWQFSVNQTVTAQGSVVATEKRVLRTIKNSLVGFGTNPWQVRYSCNRVQSSPGVFSGAAGTAGDLVDRWTTDADVTKIVVGSEHGWIVLRQTGIASNFEICIDLNSASQNNITFAFSPSAGFTGGTTTARPTATDEIVTINTTAWMSNLDVQHQIHAMQSTDGQATHVQVWRGTTNQCVFWLLGKPQNARSGWTNPSYALTVSATSALAGSYTVLNTTKKANALGSAAFTMCLTGEGSPQYGSVILANATNIGTVVNSFDGSWPIFPIGLASDDVNHQGRHGAIFDLWWKPSGVADADTFPNNASTRQFSALGNVIVPWVGDTTVALLT